MRTVDQQLADLRCNFKAERHEQCEKCRSEIKEGLAVFWISDGGMEPRDGTYMCEQCARQLCQ